MDSLPAQLILQFVLVIVNALFSATEIAVISLNKQILEEEAKKKKTSARLILKLTKNPANFLSTIQIGITLAGFLASAFAAQSFADPMSKAMIDAFHIPEEHYQLIHTVSLIIVTFLLSFFMLLFGELIPKRIAMQFPRGVSRITIGPVYCIYILLLPLVLTLSGITTLFLKIFRIKTDRKEEVTEEQIKLMLNVSTKSGQIEENEKEWIENVFDFNDTIVREVMTPVHEVYYLNLTDTKEEIFKKLEECGATRYPVCKDNINDVVGILNIKDFFLHQDKDLADLIRPASFTPEMALCDDVFRAMQSNKENFYIVCDEHGNVTGIVTIKDLIEEIVGDIYDEFDLEEEQKPEVLEDGSYKVSGDLLVEDLNKLLGSEIEISEAYDTVAGLIFSRLTEIPEDSSNCEVFIDNYSFLVSKIVNRRIIEVIVKKVIEDV